MPRPCGASDGAFTFVDIGANVGLYSLYLASCGDVRTLAIEPQPGILERLRFHLAANPSAKVDVRPVALSDRDGEVTLVLNDSDSGGTHIDKHDGRERSGSSVSASQASRCCRCCRRPASRRSMR